MMDKTAMLVSRLRSSVTVLLLALIATGIYAGTQAKRSDSAENSFQDECTQRRAAQSEVFALKVKHSDLKMQHDEDTYMILALKRRLKRYETKYGKPVLGSYDSFTDGPMVEMK